jgi:hypothetical protein
MDKSKKSGRQSQCRVCHKRPKETVNKNIWTRDEWFAMHPGKSEVYYEVYLLTVKLSEMSGLKLSDGMRPNRG